MEIENLPIILSAGSLVLSGIIALFTIGPKVKGFNLSNRKTEISISRDIMEELRTQNLELKEAIEKHTGEIKALKKEVESLKMRELSHEKERERLRKKINELYKKNNELQEASIIDKTLIERLRKEIKLLEKQMNNVD